MCQKEDNKTDGSTDVDDSKEIAVEGIESIEDDNEDKEGTTELNDNPKVQSHVLIPVQKFLLNTCL